MYIKGDGYDAIYEKGIIRISGKLSVIQDDYIDIEAFFKEVLESESSEITLDIRKLEYLNSSGIKAICIGLILEAADMDDFHMKILCSEKYTWQRETIPTFEDLMDNMDIVFEKE